MDLLDGSGKPKSKRAKAKKATTSQVQERVFSKTLARANTIRRNCEVAIAHAQQEEELVTQGLALLGKYLADFTQYKGYMEHLKRLCQIMLAECGVAKSRLVIWDQDQMKKEGPPFPDTRIIDSTTFGGVNPINGVKTVVCITIAKTTLRGSYLITIVVDTVTK